MTKPLQRSLFCCVSILFLCGCATTKYPSHLSDEVRASLKRVCIVQDAAASEQLEAPNQSAVIAGGSGAQMIGGAIGGAIAAANAQARWKHLHDWLTESNMFEFIDTIMCEDLTETLESSGLCAVTEDCEQADAGLVLELVGYDIKLWSEPWWFPMRSGGQMELVMSAMLVANPPFELTRRKEDNYRLRPVDSTNNPVIWHCIAYGRGHKSRYASHYEYTHPRITNDFLAAVTNLSVAFISALQEQPEKE